MEHKTLVRIGWGKFMAWRLEFDLDALYKAGWVKDSQERFRVGLFRVGFIVELHRDSRTPIK